jgi:CRAL/TRIO domain
MDATFDTFEQLYLAPKRFPIFFDNLKSQKEKINTLAETGVCYPLPDRDALGRRVILLQPARLNMDEYTVPDLVRLFGLVVAVVIEEEETQIAGIVCVMDYNELQLKQCFTPMEAREFLIYTKKCAPVRQKGNYFVNLPTYALFFWEMIKMMFSEKLKARQFLCKNFDDLKAQGFDTKLLPKELGGVKPEKEMMDIFRVLAEARREILEKTVFFEIDYSKVDPEKLKNDDRDAIGSFRKLEID